MLRTIHSIQGFAIHAKDGDIGHLKTLHFDDRTWKIRYLVVELGKFWDAKEVLILPNEAHGVSCLEKHIEIELTKKQVKEAQPYTSDLPVSIQQEIIDAKNFETLYLADPWSGVFLPMWFPDLSKEDQLLTEIGDIHLRSGEITDDFSVLDKAGRRVGKIKDFVIDDENWEIKYIIIDTNGIYPLGDVLVSNYHVTAFNTDNKELVIDLSKSQLERCPKYDAHAPINRESVDEYYDFEGRLVK